MASTSAAAPRRARQHASGVGEQDLADGREADRAGSAGTIEHGTADRLLQPGDLLADRGLGEPERLGGSPEGARLGDGHKRLEVTNLNVHGPKYQRC